MENFNLAFELVLYECCEFLNSSSCLAFLLHGVDEMESRTVIQEVEHPTVMIVSLFKLYEIEMDSLEWLSSTFWRVT